MSPALRQKLLVFLAIAPLAACMLSATRFSTPPAGAAPYTVRRVEHAYDPDWPDVQLLLMEKCSGCHRPGTQRSDLTSYKALLDFRTEANEPLVTPGKPTESPLWRKVVWDPASRASMDELVGPEMPPEPEAWLTAGQLQRLKRWIENGALRYKLPQSCSATPLLETDFPSAKQCKACHPRQYEQWSRSMHAYAQHSPVFEAFNLALIERTGGTIGSFCTRCHTPLGTALGENGSRRNVHRSRLSMEGVTCVVCHRVKSPYYKSSGRLAVGPGGLQEACIYGPFDNPVSATLDAHPAAKSPHIKSAAFCGTCHDVTNPQGVRLEEAFSEWQNSPAARKGITCQHCHMGPVQGLPIADEQRPLGRAAEVPGVDPEQIPLRRLSDHTFAGPDYSLLPDTEFPYKLDWMYEVDYRDFERLTPYQQKTLTGFRRRNRRQLRIADAKRYELLRNAAAISVDAPASAVAGQRVTVRVEVTSKFAGHNFPTGFTAERQAWLEVALFDPFGNPVFLSGDRDADGNLRDAHSHLVEAGKLPYDRHLLNFQSQFVALTNKGTERTVVLSVNRHLQPLNVLRPAGGISASFGRPPGFRVAKSSLPPLSSAGRNYPVTLPRRAGDYRVRVRLNFRHLPPVLLDKIGLPHLKHLLEVVVLDERQLRIRVRPDN